MKLTIVVPCYNEEEMLPKTTEVLLRVAADVDRECKTTTDVLYIDDGSSDRTWELVLQHAEEHPNVHGLKLSSNRGHQQALWAGLEWAAEHSDAAISIDADLQDDANQVLEMTRRFLAGDDIVYGVRRQRKSDTWFKRVTAQGFYRISRRLGGDVLYNHADYRLMSRRALRALLDFPERNLFLRGMVYSLGFPHSIVYYDRGERLAGESKYPLRKMVLFALDGITSFSVKPLRFIVWLGMSFMVISLIAIVYGLVSYLSGHVVPGWSSLLVSLWFIGGAILLAVGIIGEYVGKIYAEVKRRPRYFIEAEV